jgi:hypothetical protein
MGMMTEILYVCVILVGLACILIGFGAFLVIVCAGFLNNRGK